MNKMKDTDINSIIIKYRRKEKQKNVFYLTNLWAFILLLVLAVAFFFASFYYRECEWFNGFSLSLGGGLTTGLVLYLLSNLRANKYARIKKEYDSLKAIHDTMIAIIAITRAGFLSKMFKIDFDEISYQVLEQLENLEKECLNIPSSLFPIMTEDKQDLLNLEVIRNHKVEFYNALKSKNDMEACICRLNDDAVQAGTRIHDLFIQRGDQLDFFAHSII